MKLSAARDELLAQLQTVSRVASYVIDPPNGRVPALTPAGQARRASGGQGSFGVGPWNKVQDFSLYDRCITRGAVGSFMPAVYGNGARIVQTPNAVVISYEMVHDTRVIPLDDRPAVRREDVVCNDRLGAV